MATTEAPAEVFDWQRFEVVREVLLTSGMELPESGQVPLLNAHNRYDIGDVIGSFRNIRTEPDRIVGRVQFSQAAADAFTKLKEGHLTDFSVGYRVTKSQWVPENEQAEIQGKTYAGPLRVSTQWQLKELSAVPIGADPQAKARAEHYTTPNDTQEDSTMEKRLRQTLEARGLPKDATDEEAWAYLDTLTSPDSAGRSEPAQDPPQASIPPVDVRQAAIAAERDRIREITAMCARFDLADMAQAMVDAGTSVDQARKEVMEAALAKRTSEPPDIGYRGPRVEMIADERDKFRAASIDAVLLRAGSQVAAPAPGAQELAGYSLRELARHCLRINSLKETGQPMEMVGRALTTSDFPYILANVANKALFDGFDTAEETWAEWCGVGSVPDFKTNYRPRASEASDLDELPEGMEYKYGDRTETQESFSIATYGKMFAITRQTIINDDLGALTNIPQMHGEAAARKVGDVAYAILTANAAMGDGVSLFDASTHNNYVASGSGAVPGIATIAAGILAMGTQKDLQDLRRLNIRPRFFISPKALEGTAEVFFRSERFTDSDTVGTDSSLAGTRVNPYAGNYFTRVYDARLDDNDPAEWYLAAAKGKTVIVYFLNGNQKPFMESKEGWNVDGVEYKVRIDCGAKAMDWRGLYCNNGN